MGKFEIRLEPELFEELRKQLEKKEKVKITSMGVKDNMYFHLSMEKKYIRMVVVNEHRILLSYNGTRYRFKIEKEELAKDHE